MVSSLFAHDLFEELDPTPQPEEKPSFRKVLLEEGIDIGAGTGTVESIDVGLKRGGLLPDPALAFQVGQTELGPAGLEDFAARAGLAGADTAQEKILSFKRSYPNGDLKVISQGTEQPPVLIGRKEPDELFARIDDPDRFEMGDIADFFGDDIGAIAGELAIMLGPGKFLKGIKAAKKAIFGTTIGELTQEGIQELQGVQRESLGDVTSRAAIKGLASGGGAKAGELLLEKPVNALRGAGFMEVTEQASAANLAAKELLGQELFVPQVATNPIAKAIANQARLNPGVDRKFRELEDKVSSTLLGGVDKESAGKLLNELENASTRERARILSKAEEPLRTLSPSQAAASIQEGITAYEVRTGKVVDGAYDVAREAGDAGYDIAKLKLEAEEVLAGKRAAIVPEEGELAAVFPDSTGQATTRIGGAEESGILRVAQQILDLDPNLPTTVSPKGVPLDATGQLRTFRTALYDATQAPPGTITGEEMAIARKLRGALNETLNNPVSGDPRIAGLYRKANKIARDRFSTLEHSGVVAIARSDTPSVLATKIIDGSAPIETIQAIKKVIPVENYNRVKNAARTNLLEDPWSITKRMASMPKEVLAELLPPADISLLRRIGNQFDTMTQTGVQKTLKNQSQTAGIIRELVRRNDSKGIDEFQEFVRTNGGQDGPLGKSVRAGLMEDVVNKSVSFESGGVRINAKTLKAQVNELRETGADKFLKPDELKLLDDTALIQSFVSATQDAGSSIARNEAARGLLSGKDSAFGFILQNKLVGWVLTSPGWRKVLIGTGKQQLKPARILRATTAALGSIAVTPEGADKVEESIGNFVKGAAALGPAALRKGKKLVSEFISEEVQE